MGGRHRVPPRRGRRLRHLVAAAVPVVLTVAASAVVVLLVSTAGFGAVRADPVPYGEQVALVPQRPRTAPPLSLPESSGAADAVADAARSADVSEARWERQSPVSRVRTCELDGPPRFDDPAHPDMITNRDCGHTDDQGRERSRDPWIDGQLVSSRSESRDGVFGHPR